MRDRIRFPDRFERPFVAAAAACWSGVLLGSTTGPSAFGLLAVSMAVGTAIAFIVVRERSGAVLLVAIAAAGMVSGMFVAARTSVTLGAETSPGPVTMSAVVREDPARSGTAWRTLVRPTGRRVAGAWARWRGPAVLVESSTRPAIQAGDQVEVAGTLADRSGRWRGDPFAAVVDAFRMEKLAPAGGPWLGPGNWIRSRVAGSLSARDDPAAALLAGFLIGDTTDLPNRDVESLRRAGLTHYVAVSGSNVALFLSAWWLVTAPVALNARSRALAGLAGLALFVVVTRWEPSVVRAAVMAAIVLLGRAGGVPVSGWTALGGAVTLLLLVSGDLAASVGFQLSVAATAGVLAGANAFSDRAPRPLWMLLGATLAAQVAVFPLLLLHFGTVPLMAPVANLAAAPLVTGATAVGGIGVVTGIHPLTAIGVVAARAVLGVAGAAAGWPQLGPSGVGATLVVGALAVHRRFRPTVAVAVGATLLILAVHPAADPGVRPSLTVLDVGQGDAFLLRDGAGATMLVDGGRDPMVLADALRRHGVRRLDLLVVTHGDADHAAAAASLAGELSIGRLWISPQPDQGPFVETLVAVAAGRRIPIDEVAAGERHRVGTIVVDVLGPRRRYAGDNDASVVLLVDAGGPTVLLAGDIEAIAQRELPQLRPDVVVVPHHGAATSDIGWLVGLGAPLALVSVGENRYGHPASEVLESLEAAGVRIVSTIESGDLTVPLGPAGDLDG